MRKNFYLGIYSTLVLMIVFLMNCENNLQILLPQGPKGEQGEKGEKGEPGLSAFELWKQYYDKDPNTPIEDFFNSLKGKDGKDGNVPYIGGNDNWWIGGVDTGIPARGKDGTDGTDGKDGADGKDGPYGNNGKDGESPTISIGPGPDYYWIINGEVTYISAFGKDGKDGKDGENGKSAYELWVEAVKECKMTNKDGTQYPCDKYSWEDFLKWLQGGDISVLHQYWLSKGNEGDIGVFLEALFSCHCDGYTVLVISQEECVEYKAGGTYNKAYNATLKITGAANTSVTVTNNDNTIYNGVIPISGDVSIEVLRTEVDQVLSINCNAGNASEQVTKTAVIPKLKIIKLAATPYTIDSYNGNETKSQIIIEFATAPSIVLVDGVLIYDIENGGILSETGWSTNDGTKFTKIYDCKATEQKFEVIAKGANGECSDYINCFTIPQLSAVKVEDLSLGNKSNCNLSLKVVGTEGMTVTATWPNLGNPVTLTEGPDGTYTTDNIPRTYDTYTITVTASKEGKGTVIKTISVSGNNLLEVLNPLTITPNTDATPTTNSLVTKKFKNNTSASLDIKITRNNTSYLKLPEAPSFPIDISIPQNESIDIDFYRDYTTVYGTGSYTVTVTTTNECKLTKPYTFTINNLSCYTAVITKKLKTGDGGGSGNPDENVYEITVQIFDAIPNSYVEFQVYEGPGYRGFFREQADSSGKLTVTFEMKESALKLATDNGIGYFYFFTDNTYATKHNIGTTKEKITFNP